MEYESNSDRNKTLPAEEHFSKIRPYLKYFKESDTWEIQLKRAIKFMSSKDKDKERVIHSKSDNT